MNNRDKQLSASEQACLEAIDRIGKFPVSTSRFGMASDENCSQEVLRRLELRGLIQLVTELWLPLEMKRDVYRVTSAGKKLLRQNEKP